MAPKPRHQAHSKWTYAYELDPPQPEPRFTKIRTLLDRAQRAAQRDGRLWTGRIVIETNITHILVVTDDPDQEGLDDRAIAAELKRLNMDFAITGPARVSLAGPKPARRLVRGATKT